MATLIRTTLLKISPSQGPKIALCSVVQSRNICGRQMRAGQPPRPPKPAPFDYVNKEYTYLRSLFDRTTHRFDENSKVIVVEGPVASGKTCFASVLATELEMKHFEEPTMDHHYIRPNGVDMRIFDEKAPVDTRTYDHVNFNCDPCHRNTGAYQIMMYEARLSVYIDALAHVLNTGQGVVVERSPYSDFVFLEAMFRSGYISKGVKDVYYEIRNNTIEDLMRPHLVIYLDVPVPKVQEAIISRNLPYEVKGQALTPQYLQEMEKQYKEKYLRDISTHAELLVYDWTGGGEVDVVVEDIERLDFDKYTERVEPKMKDWRLPREMEWADRRMLYTDQKHHILNHFNTARTDVPELIIDAEDAFQKKLLIDEHPDFKYQAGYNKKDGSPLFRTRMSKYYEYE